MSRWVSLPCKVKKTFDDPPWHQIQTHVPWRYRMGDRRAGPKMCRRRSLQLQRHQRPQRDNILIRPLSCFVADMTADPWSMRIVETCRNPSSLIMWKSDGQQLACIESNIFRDHRRRIYCFAFDTSHIEKDARTWVTICRILPCEQGWDVKKHRNLNFTAFESWRWLASMRSHTPIISHN